jgi:hypothetical protein
MVGQTTQASVPRENRILGNGREDFEVMLERRQTGVSEARRFILKIALVNSILVLPVLLGGAAEAPKTAPVVTNVCDALRQAILVTPPASVSSLLWLKGRWECVDRALRWPPADTDQYAHLREMQFGDSSI